MVTQPQIKLASLAVVRSEIAKAQRVFVASHMLAKPMARRIVDNCRDRGDGFKLSWDGTDLHILPDDFTSLAEALERLLDQLHSTGIVRLSAVGFSASAPRRH